MLQKKLLLNKKLFQFQHYKNYSKSIKINQYKINDIINNITHTFNNISGVENLDQLKKIVVYNEKNVIVQKEILRSLRNEYEENILKRHVCQTEINSLLQRKNSWTKDDLSYYTTLITSEHNLASREEIANQKLKQQENKVDLILNEYDTSIRNRYQEELQYVEKNRGLSNMLTWIVLGSNIVIFFLTQLYIEPNRRKYIIAELLEKEKLSNQIITNEINIVHKILNQDILPVMKSLENNNRIKKSVDNNINNNNSNNLIIKQDNHINNDDSYIDIKLSTKKLGKIIFSITSLTIIILSHIR